MAWPNSTGPNRRSAANAVASPLRTSNPPNIRSFELALNRSGVPMTCLQGRRIRRLVFIDGLGALFARSERNEKPGRRSARHGFRIVWTDRNALLRYAGDE